ncbi:hypothetical protein IFR05_003166 [Cadophora sp. M221]|nr:hypothetical protein IFR05_003166 [Cadophora sp. M221]
MEKQSAGKDSWRKSKFVQRFRSKGNKVASAPKTAPPEKPTSIEAGQAGENDGKPVEAEDLVAPKPQRIERTLLPPLFDEIHPNPRVSKARDKLQESTEQLDASLKDYALKFAKYPALETTVVSPTGVQSSLVLERDFSKLIEQVQSDQKTNTESISGKVAACMSKVYPVATFALGIVSLGADAASFLPLKITANGLTQVISLASKEYNRSEDIISGLDHLSIHQPFFEDLREIGPQDLPPSIQEHSTLLLAAISDYLRVSLIFLQSRYIGKVLKVIVKDDVDEAQKAVDSAIADLDRAVNHETYLLGKRREKGEGLKNALRSLSRLRFRDTHDDIWKRRLGETGKWMLSDPQFLQWLDGSIKILWCTGLPGAGKTFVFSTIVDHLMSKESSFRSETEQKIGVAYIYCSYNDQRAQTLDALLSSIIQQLISSCPAPSQMSDPLLQLALDFYDALDDHSPQTSDYVRLLEDVVVNLNRTFVLIDALDECAEVDNGGLNARAILISTLSNMPLQLLVTSRQLESIRDLFPDTAELRIRPDRGDIQSYVKWRISDPIHGSKKLLRLTRMNEGLQEYIIDQIMSRYLQIFNLVRLQMDFIRHLSTVGELRAALSALPMREEDFYGRSVIRIRDNEAQRERAMKVLLWILKAKRPMKHQEVAHGVAIIPDQPSTTGYLDFVAPVEDLVDSCEGLVLINRESETLSFAHPTVNEYLIATSETLFLVDPDITIAQSCLTYLLFEEIQHLITLTAFKDELPKYPLLDYASTHWSSHVHGGTEDIYIDTIMRLFNQQSRLGSILPALRDACLDYDNEPLWEESSFEILQDGLWVASGLGLERVVARLIDMGADPETDSGHYRRNALHLAVERSYPNIMEQLLDAGADVDATSKYGRTALIHATEGNDIPMIRKLLEYGANADAQGKYRQTALHICAEYGFLEAARVLVEAGADVNAESLEGTVLQMAGRAEYTADDVEMVRLLLKAGARTDFRKGWRLRGEHPEFFEGIPEVEEEW